MHPDCPELARFVRGEIAPSAFPHRDHVHMAFEMLRRHDFAETVLHFSRALRAMAAKAGKAQAFNQTVTIAFLSLVAEYMERGGPTDFAVLVRDHPELLDKSALARWYRPERLASEAAPHLPAAGSRDPRLARVSPCTAAAGARPAAPPAAQAPARR